MAEYYSINTIVILFLPVSCLAFYDELYPHIWKMTFPAMKIIGEAVLTDCLS